MDSELIKNNKQLLIVNIAKDDISMDIYEDGELVRKVPDVWIGQTGCIDVDKIIDFFCEGGRIARGVEVCVRQGKIFRRGLFAVRNDGYQPAGDRLDAGDGLDLRVRGVDVKVAGIDEPDQFFFGLEGDDRRVFELFAEFGEFFLQRSVSRDEDLDAVRVF